MPVDRVQIPVPKLKPINCNFYFYVTDINERKELLEEIDRYESELKRLKNLKRSLEAGT